MPPSTDGAFPCRVTLLPILPAVPLPEALYAEETSLPSERVHDRLPESTRCAQYMQSPSMAMASTVCGAGTGQWA
jgi:hypothetical protein